MSWFRLGFVFGTIAEYLTRNIYYEEKEFVKKGNENVNIKETVLCYFVRKKTVQCFTYFAFNFEIQIEIEVFHNFDNE